MKDFSLQIHLFTWHFLENRILVWSHKSFFNQTTLDLIKKVCLKSRLACTSWLISKHERNSMFYFFKRSNMYPWIMGIPKFSSLDRNLRPLFYAMHHASTPAVHSCCCCYRAWSTIIYGGWRLAYLDFYTLAFIFWLWINFLYAWAQNVWCKLPVCEVKLPIVQRAEIKAREGCHSHQHYSF